MHRPQCRFLYLISYQVSMGSINEWLEMPKYFAIPRCGGTMLSAKALKGIKIHAND